MAERHARDEAILVIHPTEASIHEHFNRIIYRLNQRREEVIIDFRERMEEKRATTTTRLKMLQQLIDSKIDLQNKMTENVLHSMRERMTEEMDTKMRDLLVVQRETEVVFECDTIHLEQTISVLGQLIEREIISTPDYSALQQPGISVGKRGKREGRLYLPRRVAFDEKFKRIYVTNGMLGSSNISVFSDTGEYIDRFCSGEFGGLYGIAISGDNTIFVSDTLSHCIYKFKLPEFEFVSKVGKIGTGVGEFNYPRNLTVAKDGCVYVPDCCNHRIAVMDAEMKLKNYIIHQTMTRPHDVKINNSKLYVLSD